MQPINLMPWRDTARAQAKRQFLSLFMLAVLLSIGLLVLMHIYLQTTFKNRQSVNAIYESELINFNKQLSIIAQLKNQQQQLTSQIAILTAIQAERLYPITILNDLINVIPANVYLVNLQRTNNLITITGKAKAKENVSEFMRGLEQLPWVLQVTLNQIQSTVGLSDYYNDFVLVITTKSRAAKDIPYIK